MRLCEEALSSPPLAGCAGLVGQTWLGECIARACTCLAGPGPAQCGCRAVEQFAQRCRARDPALHLADWRTHHYCRELLLALFG